MNEGIISHQTSFLQMLKRPNRGRYGFESRKKKRALVLAPHADDETLGCGGTLYKLMKQGFQIEVILLTHEDRKDIDRTGEFLAALKVLGCSKSHLLKNPDGELAKYKYEAKIRILEIVETFSPDIIFSPYILDDVLDHKTTNLVLFECLTELDYLREEILIAMYEVWSPITYPNYFIDVTDIFHLKESALMCYASQEARYQIIRKAKKINALRADLSFRKNVEYMEAFKVLTANEFISVAIFLNSQGWLRISC